MTQSLVTRSPWDLDPFPSEMARFENWQNATEALAEQLRPLVVPRSWVSPVDAESAGLAQGVGALLGCPVGLTERPVPVIWIQTVLSPSVLRPWEGCRIVSSPPQYVGALVGARAVVESLRAELRELRVLRTPVRVGRLERWFRAPRNGPSSAPQPIRLNAS